MEDSKETVHLGSRGNVKGNKFYLSLQNKRVKGKWRVRGEAKPSSLSERLVASANQSYSPREWTTLKKAERERRTQKAA